MAIVNDNIFTRLSGIVALTSLVPSTRIYSGKAIQGTGVPFIVIQRVSTERVGNLSGPSGLSFVRFQFDAYANDYESAKAIADQIRFALDGYVQGNNNEQIRFGRVLDEGDSVDNSTGALLHRCRIDAAITHREATS